MQSVDKYNRFSFGPDERLEKYFVLKVMDNTHLYIKFLIELYFLIDLRSLEGFHEVSRRMTRFAPIKLIP